MNWLEPVATLLGLISVLFVILRLIWAFPIGIAMVLLYAVVFYHAKFYSDMLLQLIYVVMQIQGWYEWTRGARAVDDRIAVGRLNSRQWKITAFVQVIGTLMLGYVMHRFTDAALPWVDAFTTVMSLLAQWWMNKKYLENWALWIAVDLIYLYQYSMKQLQWTVFLYAVFTIMAVVGYRVWKKKVVPAASFS